MAKNQSPQFHTEIVEMLLNLYTETTGLPVALYLCSTQEFIWSKPRQFSPLCSSLHANDAVAINDECYKDHVKRCQEAKGTPEMCHLGLWNLALPIKINGQLIGTLISGQRRSKDPTHDSLSRRTLSKYLDTIDPEKARMTMMLFERTHAVDKKEFNEKLLYNLTRVQGHIFTLLQKSTEHESLRRSKIQNLAHEFLLPIQSIVADAENLYNEVSETELKEMANDVLQEMRKLAVIAENMRGSLIETKEQKYHFTKHSLYKCLMVPIDLYQKEANKKGVVIKSPILKDHKKMPILDMSFDYLQRAITNIIHNAVKYSYSSGPNTERYIGIVGEYVENFYCITISNYGLGILPHEIASGKIFEDGYRGELSADRSRTGSGMGLPEVKKIIDRHNGKIEIFSEPKGGPYKTTVKIYLPI
ncbi:Sensor histidine kinase ResE [Patescibacteria group bacterium]|uniref:ATP-binding protein n=1 Tax=Geobacter sp. TaxID=46610 RepID=UPI001AC194E8|nr:ATP-binding protein [Geobacter sp.]CAG1022328.1 Sensor histidine kinase ResE [Patescibacteria group bacterium]